MTDSLVYLDDRRVYWDAKKEWVEFNTHSDALIASLALHHDIPLVAIDLVVELLCTEHFKPTEVSFSKATDLYSSIGTRRQQAAWNRSYSKASPVNSVAGFPNRDTFEKVVDVLAEERRCQLEEQYGPSLAFQGRVVASSFDFTQVSQTLEAMTLVHRSWTLPAQKARRCFAIVDDASRTSQMHPCVSLLANPTLASVDTILYRDGTITSLENSLVLLRGLVLHSYSRGLRNLHIELDLYHLADKPLKQRPMKCLTHLLDSLTTLRHLKVLSVQYYRGCKDDRFIIPFCDTLTRLPSLEAMRLFVLQDVYNDAWTFEIPPWLEEKHPTTSLKSLNVSIFDAALISWLTMPRAGFRLDHIGLLVTDTFEELYSKFHPALASALQPALPFVKSLSIQGVFLWTNQAEHRFTDVQSIERAASVETLNIRIDVGSFDLFQEIQLDLVLGRVPLSTQRLSLLFFLPFTNSEDVFVGESRTKLDECIVQYIDRAKALTRLQIIVDDGSHNQQRYELLQYSREALAEYWSSDVPWLPLSQRRCENRGIAWTCRVDDATRYHIV